MAQGVAGLRGRQRGGVTRVKGGGGARGPGDGSRAPRAWGGGVHGARGRGGTSIPLSGAVGVACVWKHAGLKFWSLPVAGRASVLPGTLQGDDDRRIFVARAVVCGRVHPWSPLITCTV